MLRITFVTFLFLIRAAESGAAASPITACGQQVPAGRTGILMNDLACPAWGVCYPSCATNPTTVCLEPLQPTVACLSTAECPDPPNANCGVPPGGDLTVGVYVGRGGRLEMNSHFIAGAYFGVVSGTSSGDGAILDSGSLRVVGPGTISRTVQAVSYATRLTASGITIDDNYTGLSGTRVTAKDVVATNNQSAIFAGKRVTAQGVTLTGNGYGVTSGGSATIVDSSMTAGTYDVATVNTPRLRNVSCQHSVQLVPSLDSPGSFVPGSASWGVCSND